MLDSHYIAQKSESRIKLVEKSASVTIEISNYVALVVGLGLDLGLGTVHTYPYS